MEDSYAEELDDEYRTTLLIEERSLHLNSVLRQLQAAILRFLFILKRAFSSSSAAAARTRDLSPAHYGMSSGTMWSAGRPWARTSWLSSVIIGAMVVNISSASYLLPARILSPGMATPLAIPLLGSPNTGYCAYLTIGTPALQQFCVLVDTGSANLAIAGAPDSSISSYYSPSKSSSAHVSSQTVSVRYSVGWWEGKLVTDKIKLGAMAAATAGFTMITRAEQFYISGADWVGIMGMAYESIAAAGSGAAAFWSTLRAAAKMRDIFSIKMCPPLHDKRADVTIPKGGELLLGGYNRSLSHGDIHWTRIVEKNYYKVLMTNLSVGNSTIDMPCNEFNHGGTIMDSGTTDVYFPVNVFNSIKLSFAKHFSHEAGPTLNVPEPFWDNDYKLAWPTDALTSLYKLFPCFYVSFAFNDNATKQFSIAVTPQMYLREVEGDVFKQADKNCYPQCTFLTFGIRPRQKGTVLSSNLMIGYLCIFDRENERIGFAPSTCAYPDEIGAFDQPHIRVDTRDPINCAYQELPSTLQLVSYSFGGFIVLFTIIGATLVCIWKRMTKKCIKWYYEKTLLKKLKQMLSLSKFRRRNSRQQCLEETGLLNYNDASSLQSEDLESISVDSYANVHTDSDNNSEKSISTYQESDSAIAMMESSNISQTMLAPPVVVETVPPAVEELVFPVVVESSTTPAVVESTTPSSLQEIGKQESAYQLQDSCVRIRPTRPDNYSVIANGNYAFVNTRHDTDSFPSEVTGRIEQVRKLKQCRNDRNNKIKKLYKVDVEETSVDIVEDAVLEELLHRFVQ